MAEFLIKAVNATHADPLKDQRGCYKRGDIVMVQENGFEWGSLEALPPAQGGKFVVVRISDVTVEQVKTFVQNKLAGVPNADISMSELDVEARPTRRRRFHLTVDSLPVGVRNTLNTTGFYETTWAAVKAFLQDKVGGAGF
jgi:hypothetical protein